MAGVMATLLLAGALALGHLPQAAEARVVRVVMGLEEVGAEEVQQADLINKASRRLAVPQAAAALAGKVL
jgi:hypothetical protein